MMDEKELHSIREIIMNYGYPARGKLLALVTEVETLQIENEALKEHIRRNVSK